MATKKSEVKRNSLKVNSTPISAKEIRHYLDGVEIVTLPEACIRLGIPNAKPDGSYTSQTMTAVHTRRADLLPKPYLYGSAYYYPLDAVTEAIQKYQAEAETKTVRSDRLAKLVARLKENPDLVEMLASLVE